MSDCPAVPPRLTLEELADNYILGSGRRCFPVVEGNRALGLMTVRNYSGARSQNSGVRMKEINKGMEAYTSAILDSGS